MMQFKKQTYIDYFLERNAIRLLIDSIKYTESAKIIIKVLEILESFLGFENHSKENYKIILLKMLEESGGITKLDELQHHPDEAVFQKLESILKKYFDSL